jgi:hypothetical protein
VGGEGAARQRSCERRHTLKRYFKREWDEPRGDELDHWGTSTWYFEVGDDGHATRQLEVYRSGNALAYDERHLEDAYGGLAEPRFDGAEWDAFEISADDFAAVWRASQAAR